MNDGIARIVEMIARSEFDRAKKEVESLYQSVTNETERGALLAVNGVLVGINKKKEAAPLLEGDDKITRAAELLVRSPMADDLDRGYSEALILYAKALDRIKGRA